MATTLTISERAMLADLSIRQWYTSKHERAVTREVAANHGSQVRMGKYSKKLIAPEAIESVSKIASQARSTHVELTLPWSSNGARILSTEAFFEYEKRMHALESAFWQAVDAFCIEYPNYRHQAQTQLGTLYNSGDYPSEWDMRDRFHFSTEILPMPTASDFRVELGDTAVSTIRDSINKQLQNALDASVQDVCERVRLVVGHMADKLASYKVTTGPDGKEKIEGIFRDSLVDNVKELAEILPLLNITGNRKIEQLADQLQTQLCRFNPQTLRESPQARKETQEAADKIISRLEGLI